MATGFRSGALDLLTFLGIPTVSIGLRNMMGEGRHQLLALEKFNRVNIQYDRPRHHTTAAIKPRSKEDELSSLTVFGSPFWNSQSPDGATQRPRPRDTKIEQMQKAGNFASFDQTVVEIGYRFALEKHMGLKQTICTLKADPKTKTNELPRTITTSEARFCYPIELPNQKGDLRKHFDQQKKLDSQAIEAMRNASADLQLTDAMIKKI